MKGEPRQAVVLIETALINQLIAVKKPHASHAIGHARQTRRSVLGRNGGREVLPRAPKLTTLVPALAILLSTHR